MEFKHENSADTHSGVVKKFMFEKGWHEHQCRQCGKTFFAKSKTKTDVSTCGWHKCNNGGYHFRTFSKRKQLMKPTQISAKMGEYFRSAGFDSVAALNVANVDGQT